MAIERLDRRVSDIERRLLTRTEVPEPETREGVVVLNHSGIPELTTLVVDTLENLDLSVGDTRDEDDVARRDRTKILYRPGHAERAREIARALPGNQLIEQRDDMPNQAEIAVLIGFDLE
nr:LytR C-terminal domain-containing protein [Halorhodospira halophila]